MKTSAILGFGGLSCLLVSCGGMKGLNGPLSSDFDPLSSPGTSSSSSDSPKVIAPTYQAGQWVETVMPDAAFFRAIPQGNARADKVLPLATPMKVISTKGTHVKVELDSGEVGFVPEIMVIAKGGNSPSPVAPDFGPVPPPVDPALVPPDPGVPVDPTGTTVPPIPGVVPEPVPEVPTPVVPPVDPTIPPPVDPIPSGGGTTPAPPVVPPPTVPGVTDQ